MRVNVNETFFSPQGEGSSAGVPMFFVRFFGCNLDCSWCDQPNALSTRTRPVSYEMDSFEIADMISNHHPDVPVCFTGGEPTQQHQELVDVIEEMQKMDDERWGKLGVGRMALRRVQIETNGTIFVESLVDLNKTATHPFITLSMSPKFTGVYLDKKLGAHGETALRQWFKAEIDYYLKFVVTDSAQFEGIVKWMDKTVPRQSRRMVRVYFQPEWFKGRDQFKDIMKNMITVENWPALANLGFESIRFQPQTHKILHVQ